MTLSKCEMTLAGRTFTWAIQADKHIVRYYTIPLAHTEGIGLRLDGEGIYMFRSSLCCNGVVRTAARKYWEPEMSICALCATLTEPIPYGSVDVQNLDELFDIVDAVGRERLDPITGQLVAAWLHETLRPALIAFLASQINVHLGSALEAALLGEALAWK